jgi:hypothetical protein
MQICLLIFSSWIPYFVTRLIQSRIIYSYVYIRTHFVLKTSSNKSGNGGVNNYLNALRARVY